MVGGARHVVGGQAREVRARHWTEMPTALACNPQARCFMWLPQMVDGWVDKWINGWTVGGWVGRYVDGWMDGRIDGWVGGRMDGWVGRWIDGWVGGWRMEGEQD